MPEILVQYEAEIWQSIGETFVMVGVSILAAILIGLPVGTLLFLCRKGQILENRSVFSTLNLLVNIIRSFPFLLLVVFLIPFTRLIIGTAIGTAAATVPLAIICHCALFATSRAVFIGCTKRCDRSGHFHGCFC